MPLTSQAYHHLCLFIHVAHLKFNISLNSPILLLNTPKFPIFQISSQALPGTYSVPWAPLSSFLSSAPELLQYLESTWAIQKTLICTALMLRFSAGDCRGVPLASLFRYWSPHSPSTTGWQLSAESLSGTSFGWRILPCPRSEPISGDNLPPVTGWIANIKSWHSHPTMGKPWVTISSPELPKWLISWDLCCNSWQFTLSLCTILILLSSLLHRWCSRGLSLINFLPATQILLPRESKYRL